MTSAARSPVPAPAVFLDQIADALAVADVRYCQWKGHWKRARWSAGDGDVDLLVAPESLPRMVEVLTAGEFKVTVAPEDYRLIGAWHYRAPDPDTGRILHLHVHTRLLTEAARGTVYRLPVEEAMLASSSPGTLFPTPSPELETLVLVVRTTLRWASWRRIPKATRAELAYLESLTETKRILDALARHLPAVDAAVYLRCRQALEPGATLLERWSARRGLTQALEAFARQPTMTERTAHALAAAAWHLRGGPRPYSRAAMNTGGSVIALSGTDGAGKSTCARALTEWLSPHVTTRAFHMGRAPRSIFTLFVGGAFKVSRALGAPARWLTSTLQLVRQVCNARDRWLLAREIATEALNGAVCIVERYPLGPDHALVGPRVRELAGAKPSALARRLADWEERYYRRLPAPDHVFVLQVEPERAVRRKTDEPSDYVRARALAMRHADWSGTSAQLLDANRPLADVIAELRACVWRVL